LNEINNIAGVKINTSKKYQEINIYAEIRISPAGLGLPEKTFYQRFPNDSSIQVF
jgi:hypothetical protein